MSECFETDMVPYRNKGNGVRHRNASRPFFDSRSTKLFPPVEITEDGDGFVVYVELPGASEEDLNATFANGNLYISGEKRPHSDKMEDLCYCSERNFGSFARVIPLSTSVDADKLSARFERGVLEVFLPKREDAKPKKVKVIGS